MPNKNTEELIINKLITKKEVGLIRILTIYFCTIQLLNIFRSTYIYNTNKINNVLLIVLAFIFVFKFIKKVNILKFNYIEAIIILIPIIYYFFGLFNNGFTRNLLSTTHNSIIFGIILIYSRNSNFDYLSSEYETMANLMMNILLLSLVIYYILPFVGIPVISIAKTFFVFTIPLLYFIVYNKRKRAIVSLLLLLLSGKRSILISLVILLFFSTLMQKRIAFKKRILAITLSIFLSGLILGFAYSPITLSKVPKPLYPMLYKIMLINPLSEYNSIRTDSRIREIEYSLEPLNENKLYLLTGMGPGYTYKYYDTQGNLYQEDRHNTHFSPVSIYTKYGVLYFIILYSLYITVIIKNVRIYNNKDYPKIAKFMTLYLMGSLINSFTEFTIYTDFISIIFLGTLSKRSLNKPINNIVDTGKCMEEIK